MDNTELIQRGLQAWAAGDLDALEAILDPRVTLRWVEPGPWDCTGRDQVMRLLRERQAERDRRRPTRVHIGRLDGRTFVVTTENPIDDDGPQSSPVATRITVTGGKVTAMQQYRHDQAIADS